MAYRRDDKPTKKRGRLRRIFSLRNEYGEWYWGRIIAGVTILALIAFIFFFTMLYSIGVGQAGLIVDPMTQTISPPVTGPTYGIKWPWQNLVVIPYARESLGMWGESIKYGIALFLFGFVICNIPQEKLLERQRKNASNVGKNLENIRAILSRNFCNKEDFVVNNVSGNLCEQTEKKPFPIIFESLVFKEKEKKIKFLRSLRRNIALPLKLNRYATLLLLKEMKFSFLKLKAAMLSLGQLNEKPKNFWAKNTILLGLPSTSPNGTDEFADFPAIDCFSDEGSELSVDIMIRWQIDLNKLKELYNSYPGLNWEDRAVASVARESIRFVMGEYKVMYIVENREGVALEIEQKLIEEIATEPSLQGALINIEIDLRNIGISEQLSTAIDSKLAAEQAKLEAEFEAQRIVTLAEAEANALLIGANATAQQKIIDAAGIQEAINVLISDFNMTNTESNEFLELYVTLKTLENIAKETGVYFVIGEDGLSLLLPTPEG